MTGFMKKLQEFWTPPAEEYEERHERDGSEDGDMLLNKRLFRKDGEEEAACAGRGKKVVNINATARLQVVICRPERFTEEIRAIADELLESHTVVLNLEESDKDAYRRILDFLSGVAYAKGGKIKRIATNTYIITPCNVDLTGEDLVDELESNGVYF